MTVAPSAVQANGFALFEHRSQLRLIPSILNNEVTIWAAHRELPGHGHSVDASVQAISRRFKALVPDLQDQCSIRGYGLANRADEVRGIRYLLARLGTHKVRRTTALALRAYVAQPNLQCRSIHERMLPSLTQSLLTSVKPDSSARKADVRLMVRYRAKSGHSADDQAALAKTGLCLPCHATVPNRAPTLAVRAMASAPQNVTRIAPTCTLAPPARAANPPKIARNTNEVPETTGIRLDPWTMAAATNGIAAPTAKLAADVNAA